MSLCFKGIDVIAVKETINRLWQHHDAVLYKPSKHFTSECVEAGKLCSSTVSVLSGQP
jgi:hypothetical protein